MNAPWRRTWSATHEKINDPNIKGPFETGWGFTDWTPDEAQRMLVALPTPDGIQQGAPEMARDLNKEAWCWQHLTSEEFYRGGVAACEAVRDFFKMETLGRGLANYGRNNQIYDSWARHARELAQAIEFTRYGDYQPLDEVASSIESTNRGINQWVFMGWLGEAEPEYHRLAEIAGNYASLIQGSLQCGLVGGLYWLEDAADDLPERRNRPMGMVGDSVTIFLDERDYQARTPEENYPHLRKQPSPTVFPRYEPDTSRPVKTGETVPWTGTWMPESDIEKDGLCLTFAIKGRPMTPVWRLVKTYEEIEQELLQQPGYIKKESGIVYDPAGNVVTSFDQYEIAPTIWYPLLEAAPVKVHPFSGRVEGGQPCPREGYWWLPAVKSGSRFFKKGEIMPKITSTEYAESYWLWGGEAEEK